MAPLNEPVIEVPTWHGELSTMADIVHSTSISSMPDK
jgi:hypothetical protein